ncbi:MAG: hypothetical protein IPL88_11865 [Rhizobiales bacterium]|nr:hypothetical protein [Hyphomicrobiales bacterium]
MAGHGRTNGWLRRAAIANALVWLLILQSVVSVAGAMRAYGAQLNDGPFLAALCTSVAQVGGEDGDRPVEPVRTAFHCILCPTSLGGMGPAILAAPALAPPVAVDARRLVSAQPSSDPPPRAVGQAFAWSSRAPPFNA